MRCAMNCLNRSDRLGKEKSRLPDEPDAFADRDAGQYLGDQDLFMKLGDVQRLHAGGQRLLAHAPRPLQMCL